jgi:phosphoglycerol transferase
LEEKDTKKALASAVVLFLLVLTVFINLFPMFIDMFNGAEFGLTGTRDTRDVERYNLRFVQLLLPIKGHRIPLMARLKDFYEYNISTFYSESHASSLGLFISIGFVISLFIAMIKNDNNKSNISIKHSSVLNIFTLILGSVGGISSLIAFFIPFIRCYNRLSIFIAFYSLYIISYYLDFFLIKYNIKKIIQVIIIVLICTLAAFDMVGAKNTAGNKNIEDRYYIHKEFVKKIEDVTPNSSMIFQLPFVSSGHHENFKNMYAYEQFIPIIHSSSLKWSSHANVNSPVERWQKFVANKSVEDMFKHLAGVGFIGLFVDTYGYIDNEYNQIRDELIKISGIEPIISKDRRMEYFYLGEYFENLYKTFNEREKKIYELLYINTIISDYNSVFEVSNQFGNMLNSGWNNAESWGVWSEGKTAKIEFAVLDKSDFSLNMVFDVIHNPTSFSIDVNGIRVDNFSFTGNNTLRIPISKDYLKDENSIFPVTIQFNIDNPRDPVVNDPRRIGIGLHRFSISKNK